MDESDLAEKRIGLVIRGKWTLERLLGVGGMAAVYVARHKIGRLDAIKILHPEFAHTAQIRQRFEQEAHVLNRFKHPGAVEVRDMDVTEDGAPFLVMELLEGAPLSRVFGARTLTPDEVLLIADETLDVLAAAHAQGIVHRDVKPDNLFILPSGRVKVLDFGIAQLRAPKDGAPQQLKTKTGTTLGTIVYMPPEQALGKTDVDARVDVYAVGATMFRLLAGRHVHTGESEVELLMKIVTEPAPKLGSVAPGIAPPLCAVVDRALAFDRDARYPDAKSMQADVRAVREGRAVAVAAPPLSAAQREARTVTPMREGSSAIDQLPPASRLATRAVPSYDADRSAAPPTTRSIDAGAGYSLQGQVAPAVAMAPSVVLPPRGDARKTTLPVSLPWLVAGGAVLAGVVLLALVAAVVLSLRSSEGSASGSQPAPTSSVPSARPLGPVPTHPVFWTTGTAEGR